LESNVDLKEEELNELVSKLDGLSGSDISLIMNEALMEPIRELEKTIYWKQSKRMKIDTTLNTTTNSKSIEIIDKQQWIPIIDKKEKGSENNEKNNEEEEMQLKSSLYDLPSDQIAPPRNVNMVKFLFLI